MVNAVKESPIPNISQFNGIDIYMYYNDHMPPHFHAFYSGKEVIILIRSKEQGGASVHEGEMSSAQLKLILKWADTRYEELTANWERARQRVQLQKVAPLTSQEK